MDVQFTPEEIAFRNEVRTFLENDYPAELRGKFSRDEYSKEDFLLWQKTLFKRGWGAPAWPKKYGGTGWTATQRYIFQEECARAETLPIPPFGMAMLAPVLMAFASEEQKAHYLPRIIDGTDFWCQGYSEPGAGSDLASLKTKAERVGDHYIINGQKTWTTLGHFADWIFVLCRTDPTAKKPQEGISFILVDIKTPGVEVRPIITMDGGHEVNETWFTDVKVPVANLVGKENEGWTYAKYLLAHERTGIAGVARSKKGIERLREIASVELDQGQPIIRNAGLRQEDFRTGDRSDGAGIHRAAHARPREPGQGPGAGILDPQDQGHGNPAAHYRADAGSRWRLWRALFPRLPAGWRQPASDRAGLRAPDGADVRQHAQDLDLWRLERDPAQHHREDGAGALETASGRGDVIASRPVLRSPHNQPPSEGHKGGKHVRSKRRQFQHLAS